MHVLFALVIGIFGYRFVSRPPQILEVALVGGGGGAPEQVEEQQDNSILRSIDDIIDKRLKPETKKVVTKKTVPSTKPQPGTSNNQTNGPSNATGNGSGTGSGTGSGSGDGAGAGEGRGVPVTPPRVVSAMQPKYPSSARSAGIEGVVGVKMLGKHNTNVWAAVTGDE